MQCTELRDPAREVQPLAQYGHGFVLSPVRANPLRAIGFVGFVSLYVVLLAWFGAFDLYNTRFFQTGGGKAYLAYNAFRILYLAYLACMLYYVGLRLVRWIEGRGVQLGLGLLDEFILCFYAGAAVLSVLVFVLGYFNLYYRSVAIVITLPLVCASYGSVVDFASRLWCGDIRKWAADPNRLRSPLRWVSLACVAILAILLLVCKGLPPGGGGDYYTHYFPYYKHVVQSHGLWPNDVWYHYYVSKGATLTVFSILLTDFQSPELVTYLFVLVSALALFSILRKFTNNTAIPFTGMAAYLGAFVYTNQPGNISEWGLFQKHHEFTASLLASVAWAAVMFKEGDVPRRKAWTFFTSLLVMHTILFAPTTFPLVFLTFALLVLAAAVKRSWPLVHSFSVVGGVAAAVLLSLMANNYLVTGMAEITPFRTYWKYADQQKFSKSWSPYLMVLLEEGSAPGMGDIQVVEHTNITRFEYIKQIVRAHTIRYFLPGWDLVSGKYVASVLVCACVVLYLVGRRAPFQLWRVAIPIGGMLLVAVGLSQIVNQPISAYRYFSFTVFFTVTGVVVLWIVLFRLLPSRKLTGFTSYLLPTGLTCWITVHTFIALPDEEFRFCRDYALGRTSLADGYAYRQHAVYPPAVAIRRLIGPEARVYTFNQNNYSMAPGCELESFVSFALRTDWHEIMFEPPERARELLQKQGLNYFLIDFDSLVLDLSQHSALFQPANVEKYFGVRWRQGNVYLLTWRGNDTEPILKDFMCRYNDDYFNKWFCTRPLYERVKLIYEVNKGNPYPIRRDPTLPPVKGWQ